MRTPLFSLFALALLAQAQPRPFEVASVKLHQGQGKIGFTTSGPRFNAEAELLRNLIAYAFNLKRFLIADSPALRPFDEQFYDVVAKVDGDLAPPAADFHEALKRLLVTRFHLAVHFEKRELAVYVLLTGKNGPKLRKSTLEPATPPVHFAAAGRNWEASSNNATLADLLQTIENSILDRPVIDQTGITGAFAFQLTFTAQTPLNRRNPEPDDILIFEALERQLGLRLEAQNSPVDMLIVDRAERPTAN